MTENSVSGSKYSINVGKIERLASIAAGSVLMIKALKKRKASSVLEAVAGGYLLFRGLSGHCSLYKLAGKHNLPDTVKNINIRAIMFVNRPRHEVYAFWRNLSNLPLFMQHLKKVKNIDSTRSKWQAWLPGKIGAIKWKSEIVKEEPGRLLGWNSLPGSAIANAGKVEFRDVEGGTELRVVITYRAPLRELGSGISRLFTPAFEKYIEDDIYSFKQYIETGTRPQKNKGKKTSVNG